MFESFNIIEGVLCALSFGVVHLIFRFAALEREINQKIENLKDSNLELMRQVNKLSSNR